MAYREFYTVKLDTKIYQTNDNILYIPRYIKIYIEIPNGPQQFLDDYPILTLFQRTNITLDKKLLSDNTNGIFNKNLMWEEKEIDLEDKEIKTCIENNNYMKIIKYLSIDIKEEDKGKYNEKIKKAAKYLNKCVYSEKLRIKDITQKNKTEKEKKDYIFKFFDFDEKKAEIMQGDNATVIFKTKNGFKEIDISDKEIKDKDTKYFIKNLKEVMSLNESVEEIEKMIGEYKILKITIKK